VGRVLHRLFEAMLRDESLDVRLHAGNLLKDEERDAVELAEVMRVVDAVQSAPLWQRVNAADERYVEVPFAFNVLRRDVGIDEDCETLLTEPSTWYSAKRVAGSSSTTSPMRHPGASTPSSRITHRR
jgi:hypothetical protein